MIVATLLHVVDTVYKLSLSGPPVTIRLNYWPPKNGVNASNKLGQCRRESYSQQPNFHWTKCREKIKTPSPKSWSEPRCRKEIENTWLRVFNIWSLTPSVPARLPGHCPVVKRGFLCLFNYCNSGPPTECLHLPLSEVRDGKILRKSVKASSPVLCNFHRCLFIPLPVLKRFSPSPPVRLFVVSIRRTLF